MLSRVSFASDYRVGGGDLLAGAELAANVRREQKIRRRAPV